MEGGVVLLYAIQPIGTVILSRGLGKLQNSILFLADSQK